VKRKVATSTAKKPEPKTPTQQPATSPEIKTPQGIVTDSLKKVVGTLEEEKQTLAGLIAIIEQDMQILSTAPDKIAERTEGLSYVK
jgi:hypothetical protein